MAARTTCVLGGFIIFKMEITQKKSNEELKKKGDEIIDSLRGFNPAEKYKIISGLYNSLIDIMKEDGMVIIEKDLKEKNDTRKA